VAPAGPAPIAPAIEILLAAAVVRETTLVSSEAMTEMFITPPLELDTAIFDGWDTLTGMAHL
jgi:hypothetical protein